MQTTKNPATLDASNKSQTNERHNVNTFHIATELDNCTCTMQQMENWGMCQSCEKADA